MRESLAFIGLVAAVFLVASSGEGIAKPKRLSFGCTMTQIMNAASQTPAGRECSRRQDEAAFNGTTSIVFVCTSTGVFCCPENGTSEADCTRVSALSSRRHEALNSILQRGALRATSRAQPVPGASSTTQN